MNATRAYGPFLAEEDQFWQPILVRPDQFSPRTKIFVTAPPPICLDKAQNEDKPHQQGTCFISNFVQSEVLTPSQWYIKGSAKYPKLVIFIYRCQMMS